MTRPISAIILQFGLIPANYTGGGHDLVSQVVAPLTYQFLHGGWMHLGINMITLAAFGAPVERLLGVRRFILFYLSAGIVAGVIHILFFPGSTDPVIGASGAISGVFGGVLMLMRYVGSLTSLLPVAGILDRPQRLLRHLRWHAGGGRRAGRLGCPYRRLRLRASGHSFLHAAADMTGGRDIPCLSRHAGRAIAYDQKLRHPDRSRAQRGVAEGPVLLPRRQEEVPRLRRPRGGFARDDGKIITCDSPVRLTGED